MYLTFPVSQREFLRAQQTGKGHNVESIKVKLRYSDGAFYDQLGVINFVDVSVDRATDTVTVRATVPNPKEGLIDGQLMRVVLEAGEPEEKIVIPQSALIADQEGVYVFVVEDGKAAVKRIRQGAAKERVSSSTLVCQAVSWSLLKACKLCDPACPFAQRRCLQRPIRANKMLSSIFVDRPRLAIVIAVVTTIAGILALFQSPLRNIRILFRHRFLSQRSIRAQLGSSSRRDGCPTDRGSSRRRRQDDLHEERQRRRRQLFACCFIRTRYQSRYQRGQCQ